MKNPFLLLGGAILLFLGVSELFAGTKPAAVEKKTGTEAAESAKKKKPKPKPAAAEAKED